MSPIPQVASPAQISVVIQLAYTEKLLTPFGYSAYYIPLNLQLDTANLRDKSIMEYVLGYTENGGFSQVAILYDYICNILKSEQFRCKKMGGRINKKQGKKKIQWIGGIWGI